MLMMNDNDENIEETDVKLYFQTLKMVKVKKEKKLVKQISIIENKTIKVKNINQFKYMDMIQDSTITFGIGPAGTGKNIFSCCKRSQTLFRTKN